MPSVDRYKEAIAAAKADNNDDAVAELQRRLAEEHPNAGGTASPKIPNKTDSEFAAAIEKAEADNNPEAVAKLRLWRGIRRAEADNNPEAVAELTSRLSVPQQPQGNPDLPDIGNFEDYSASHRAALEQQQAGYEAEAARQGTIAEYYDKPMHERAIDSVAQAGATVGQIPRAIINTPSNIGNLFGGDYRSVTDVMGIDALGKGDYIPEGTLARTAAEAAGMTAEMGLGFAPVQRAAGKTSSVVADVLGMGSSVDDAADLAALAAQRGASHIPDVHRGNDVEEMVDIDWNNDETVQRIVQQANDEVMAMDYAEPLAELDKIEFKRSRGLAKIDDKQADGKYKSDKHADARRKKLNKAADRMTAEVEANAAAGKSKPYGGAMEFGNTFDESVVRHLARRYDMPEQEVLQHVLRSGGVNHSDSLSEIRVRRYAAQAEEMYATTGQPKHSFRADELVDYGFWNQVARPATALLRENVGKGFSSRVERAFIRAGTKSQEILSNYQAEPESFKAVVEWGGRDDIKRQFLDLRTTGVEGRARLIQQARQELGEDAFAVFNQLLDDSAKFQKENRSVLYGPDAKLDEVYWGTSRGKDRGFVAGDDLDQMGADKIKRTSDPKNVAAMQERSRGEAARMAKEGLDEYDNPIISQLQRMTEDQDLIELFRALEVPPQLLETGDLGSVRGAIVRHVQAVTGDANKAKQAGAIVGDILQGSRRSPPKAMRTFMNFAYGGTLGQIDSAILNLHDVFTSFWRQGLTPTVGAVMETFKKNGVKAKDFGISDANIGEFREGVQQGLDQASGKAEKLSKAYSDLSFTLSGFRALDLGGKGVIMRATLKDMQRLAQKGKGLTELRDKYGHLMSNRELAEVTNVLRNKKDVAEMSPRQREIVGNAMLGRLAEQQLLSSASRPLTYLRNPTWRPVWAMSGFAIRQADILKQEVYDLAAKGDYAGAGAAFAGWAAWSVGGYVFTDTMRDQISAQVTGKESKKANWENTKVRAIEGFSGPLTLNKLGDPYSQAQFMEDPVGYAFESMLPPTGLVGSAVKGASNAATEAYKGATDYYYDPDYTTALAEVSAAVPAVGRLMADYLKENKED